MTSTKTLILLAGVAASAAPAMAQTAEPVSRDEVRAIVSEMLQDAESRTSLLQGGMTAGRDDKFFLASSDGNYRLNVGGFTQFRYIVDFRNSSSTDNSFQPGFQFRRNRLEIGGNVVNPNLTFFISNEFSNSNTGGSQLRDSYVNYNFGGGWSIRAGQFKLPFLREELVSDVYQMSSERSLVNSAFTLERSMGVQGTYSADEWRMMGMFSQGANAKNTDFGTGTTNGAPSLPKTDYALTARAEFKLAGKDFSTFKDFTSAPDSDFALLVGVAGHFQDSSNSRDVNDIDSQFASYTADVTLKSAGLSAYAAFVGTHNKTRGDGAGGVGIEGPDQDNYGFVGQVGYRFGNIEPFARYDGLFYDRDTIGAVGPKNQSFLTIGVNDYFAGHAAKLTVDAIISLNNGSTLTAVAPGATAGFNNGQGLQPSDKGGQVALRAQFQLMF